MICARSTRICHQNPNPPRTGVTNKDGTRMRISWPWLENVHECKTKFRLKKDAQEAQKSPAVTKVLKAHKNSRALFETLNAHKGHI